MRGREGGREGEGGKEDRRIEFFCCAISLPAEVVHLLHWTEEYKGQRTDKDYWDSKLHCRPRLLVGWQWQHTVEGNGHTHSKRTANFD